jgi:hypothetical protein
MRKIRQLRELPKRTRWLPCLHDVVDRALGQLKASQDFASSIEGVTAALPTSVESLCPARGDWTPEKGCDGTLGANDFPTSPVGLGDRHQRRSALREQRHHPMAHLGRHLGADMSHVSRRRPGQGVGKCAEHSRVHGSRLGGELQTELVRGGMTRRSGCSLFGEQSENCTTLEITSSNRGQLR